MREKILNHKILTLTITAIFLNCSYGKDSLWICANQKSDIPDGYYVVEISKDLSACAYNKQNMLISKVKDNKFWMCNFVNMGAPSGYVITRESKVETCGCQAPLQDGYGKVYCFPTGSEGHSGWPKVSVLKLN